MTERSWGPAGANEANGPPGRPPRPIPVLSVVLPCYRAAATAMASVDALVPVLQDNAPNAWEIVVVDDGGGDFADDPWPDRTGVRLLRLSHNLGKGAAVKTGMLAARGKARIYTDVDLPYGVHTVPLMASYLLDAPFHFVMGDRNLPGSSYRSEIGLDRRILSGAATFFIGTLVTGGVFDTQCGLKAVRGDVADLLFPLVQTERFAFDVEVVYLALRFNCDIKRIPVAFAGDKGPSSVRPVVDAARSMRDILLIKRRASAGRYESPPLQALINAPVEDRLRRLIAEPRELW